ncbi:MAG: transaldolase [Actinomycetota bacterium]
MSKLHELKARGQSIWVDNLRRDLVSSGELQRLITEDGVSGVTSNPTILAAAITASPDYDGHITELARSGASVIDLYASLVATDILSGCDVLHPVWEESNRLDGFVSVEVSPAVSNDTDATVAEAHDWIKRIDRDNLLVKVPATEAGVAAIERLTAEGVSVNVTLIFSLARYRDVIEAYLAGIERFISSGGDPRKVVSFASFFVSRVDTEVDRRLDEMAGAERAETVALRGKAGIANARVAYGIFTDAFSTERWAHLAAAGAHAQEPLWASTGVKDPAYRDTMYVEELIAADTVNTMPEATIRAFQHHGDTSRTPFTMDDIAEARQALDALRAIGVDVEDIATNVLEPQGIDKFARSFDELVARLEEKRSAHSSIRPRGPR